MRYLEDLIKILENWERVIKKVHVDIQRAGENGKNNKNKPDYRLEEILFKLAEFYEINTGKPATEYGASHGSYRHFAEAVIKIVYPAGNRNDFKGSIKRAFKYREDHMGNFVKRSEDRKAKAEEMHPSWMTKVRIKGKEQKNKEINV